MEMNETQNETTSGMDRRDFIKKSLKASGGLFVGLTLSDGVTTPLLNTVGNPHGASSRAGCNNGVGNGQDCLPPGLQNNGRSDLDNDDGDDDAPGNPGNRGGNRDNGNNGNNRGNNRNNRG